MSPASVLLMRCFSIASAASFPRSMSHVCTAAGSSPLHLSLQPGLPLSSIATQLQPSYSVSIVTLDTSHLAPPSRIARHARFEQKQPSLDLPTWDPPMSFIPNNNTLILRTILLSTSAVVKSRLHCSVQFRLFQATWVAQTKTLIMFITQIQEKLQIHLADCLKHLADQLHHLTPPSPSHGRSPPDQMHSRLTLKGLLHYHSLVHQNL